MPEFRFFKRIRLYPGLYVNLSPSGLSLTARAFRGFSVTLGRRGLRETVSLPGSGASLSWRQARPRTWQLALAIILGATLALGLF